MELYSLELKKLGLISRDFITQCVPLILTDWLFQDLSRKKVASVVNFTALKRTNGQTFQN